MKVAGYHWDPSTMLHLRTEAGNFSLIRTQKSMRNSLLTASGGMRRPAECGLTFLEDHKVSIKTRIYHIHAFVCVAVEGICKIAFVDVKFPYSSMVLKNRSFA